MATYEGLYRAKVVHLNGNSVDAFVPQVFGRVPIRVTEPVGGLPTSPGMGWVLFQGGNPEFPVWVGVTGGGGGGAGDNEVWVGPDEPTDPDIELWYDTDATPEGEGFLGPQLWTWESSSAPPLGRGMLATSDDPSVATEMYLSSHDLFGIDWGLAISDLQAGDHVTLQFAPDSGSWHRYTLTGVPFDSGDTWVFPVETIAGSPVGTAPPVGSPILVSFEASSEEVGPVAYTYVQSTPAQVWYITHDLAFRPNITVVDSSGAQCEGDVVYSGTQIIVTFSGAFSGTAYLS